jgi:hypothetical protein
MPDRTEAEYLQNADECRRLARTVPNVEQQEKLLQMAETWERIARKNQEPDPRPKLVKAMDGS